MTADNQPILIGLLGKARSGKNTFAQGLSERGYTQVAFADPLREMTRRIDPWLITPPWQPEPNVRLSQALDMHGGWEGVKETAYGPEMRRLLQETGQAVRALKPDFWLDAGMKKAHDIAYHGTGYAVITDVRYRNEAKAVQRAGGVLIRIERPGLESTDTHSSEVELDDYPADMYVLNDGSMDDLLHRARTIQF